MNYRDLKDLDTKNKTTLQSMFNGILDAIKNISFRKSTTLIKDFPSVCELSYISHENSEKRKQSKSNMHPIIPTRGEIYNAYITEGVGKELSGNHLVVVIQNEKSNIYSDKVTVVPIEGDGNRIKSSYQVKLSNSDLSTGKLDKDPSRIIYADIMSLDKARLGRRIGTLSNEKMKRLDLLLKKHLSL